MLVVKVAPTEITEPNVVGAIVDEPVPEIPPVAAVTIELEAEEAPAEVAEPDAVAVMVDEPVTPPVAAITIGCATGFATWTGLITAVGTGATAPT